MGPGERKERLGMFRRESAFHSQQMALDRSCPGRGLRKYVKAD